jgi:hypothetical protein
MTRRILPIDHQEALAAQLAPFAAQRLGRAGLT